MGTPKGLAMSPELHLFILWQNARTAQSRVLADLGSSFRIRAVYEVHWTKSIFAASMSRFYGKNLPPGSRKEEECGVGPFLLVLIEDMAPLYAVRNTSKGPREVNSRLFDQKSLYRQWTGGGTKVHATNNPRETNHDLMLLLHVSPADFLEKHAGDWNGSIVSLQRDVAGTNGWASMHELLGALNATIEYVVLRNFECLPHRYHMPEHGDIDLLVADYGDARLLTNAVAVFPDPRRVHHHVRVGSELVPFDFRHVGDGYMDEKWERELLRNRVLRPEGFHSPAPADYFYSLLYHAAVHKPRMKEDYVERLTAMAKALSLPELSPALLNDPRLLRRFLTRYLREKGYRYSEPKDPSVVFNEQITGRPRGGLKALLARDARRALVHPVKILQRAWKRMFLS